MFLGILKYSLVLVLNIYHTKILNPRVPIKLTSRIGKREICFGISVIRL